MEPTRDARARALPWTRQGDDPPGPRNTRSDACKADASALAGLAGKGRSLASLAGYGLKKLWQDVLCRRQWYLAIRPGNGDPLRKGFATEPFRPLIPKDKTGWADPFLVRHGGRTWLFVEEIPYRQKGHISVMELLPGGATGEADGTIGDTTGAANATGTIDGATGGIIGEPRRVLEEPFHLSYPNVFESGGQMYMIPESAKARQVRLYRAVEFPWRWELDRVLLEDVPATDATLLQDGTGFWMFATVRPVGGSSWDRLHLFRGESLFGPYRPHPQNPVVADVGRARPGGRIIRRDGRIVRPGQDSSGWYGRALAMMEITRLDETGYAEREVARLEAGLIPQSVCLHTFAAGDGFEIVDGQRFVPFWR